MSSRDQKSVLEKTDLHLKIFHRPDQSPAFPGTEKGKKASESYIILTRGQERGFLFIGAQSGLEAEAGKDRIKMLNDGWHESGRVHITLDGRSDAEKEMDDLFTRDYVRVELGRNLLPLADPESGAPLMEIASSLRKDIAVSSGVVIPGIRISDNMTIPHNNYIVYIKETPAASGEIFLDRFLVMGPMEELSKIQGWSTRDPAYNTPAKWVEKDQLPRAEETGCIVMGPLNVMITHLRETVSENLKSLLGLQETHHLLNRLSETHPAVVDEFISDMDKVRKIRKILHGLLSERVGIKDLVTIMEVIGDHQDKLEKTDLLVEMVRLALSRQICWSYLGPEGKITALALSDKMEEMLQNSTKETKFGFRLALEKDQADEIIKNLKKTLEDYKNPPVIFCDPPSRPYFRKLTERNFPGLGILSTAEIDRGIPVEIAGRVELPAGIIAVKPAEKQTDEEKERKQGGIFGLLKS